MLTTILLLLAAAIAAVLLAAAFRPAAFRVQRAISIGVSAEHILPYLNDLRAFTAWSPYEADPEMKRTFSDNARGPGASYAWESEGKAGVGKLQITAATASKVELRLEFIKPFAATNTAEFTLESAADGTRTTWSMSGAAPYVCRLFGLFIDMDKLVGRDFEAGLKTLKTLAESRVAA